MNNKKTYMSLRDIAKYFCKSISYIQKKCKQLILDDISKHAKPKMSSIKNSAFDKFLTKNLKEFSAEQIAFFEYVRF